MHVRLGGGWLRRPRSSGAGGARSVVEFVSCVNVAHVRELGQKLGPHHVDVGPGGGKWYVFQLHLCRHRPLSLRCGSIQPPLDALVPPLPHDPFSSDSWGALCCSGCAATAGGAVACGNSAACGVAALQLPEPGGLVFVLWAGVPGEVTAALPESDKEASLALVAPYPTVQVVVPKGLFGAWQLVWAPRAPEVNDVRGGLPCCPCAMLQACF